MYIYHGLVTYHTYLQMFINLFINLFVVAVKLITLVAQSRHLSTRIKKHLKTDKKSHVYKQLNESQ